MTLATQRRWLIDDPARLAQIRENTNGEFIGIYVSPSPPTQQTIDVTCPYCRGPLFVFDARDIFRIVSVEVDRPERVEGWAELMPAENRGVWCQPCRQTFSIAPDFEKYLTGLEIGS